jgi:hypothetical protein
MKTILYTFVFFAAQFLNAQDWQQVGSGIDGNVICMEELDGKIYVGGNYTGSLNYISQWTPATQQWTDISNDFITYAVMGMSVSDGKLYVGGLNQWASGDVVASFDPTTNIWTGHGNAGGVNAISEIFVKNNYIYIGGNGYSKKSEIGSSVWTNMAVAENAAQIRGFAAVNDVIYINKEESADLWDDYTFLSFDEDSFLFNGEALEWSTFGSFQDLEVVGTDIYCTGGFYVDTDFQRIARFDTQTNTFHGLPGCPSSASNKALHNDGIIYFGGNFQSPYSHVVAYYIADGSWHSLGNGLSSQVSDLAIIGNTLYAIGNFSNPIDHVAQFDLASLTHLEESVNQNLRVYPNPCLDVLFFESGLSSQEVRIFDIFGKEVYSRTMMNQRLEIESLLPGYYTVVVENSDKRARILKMH